MKTITCSMAIAGNYFTDSCLSENRCPSLLDIPFAVADMINVTEGSIIQYSCQPGYQFNDGSNVQPVRCLNKAWVTEALVTQGCQSKYWLKLTMGLYWIT